MGDYLDDEMKIACCVACTLADVMRHCETCPFRIGLLFRLIKQNETLSADNALRVEERRAMFVFSLQCY